MISADVTETVIKWLAQAELRQNSIERGDTNGGEGHFDRTMALDTPSMLVVHTLSSVSFAQSLSTLFG
jgi:hypothetical protein